MAKDDIVGIFGAVLSSVFATLGFLWGIGALQLIFSFLAGSFTTYLVQRRLQAESEKRRIRRENAIIMRDNIYGPMFEGLSEILERVKSVQPLVWEMPESLKAVRAHYLFFTIRQDLRSELSAILDRFDKYERIRRATEIMIQGTIRKEIEKAYHVDIGLIEYAPDLTLLIGQIHVAGINLMRALLQGIEPRDFVRMETEKWGKDMPVEVSIGAKKGDLGDFESLYKAVLHKVEEEPLFRDEKEQRARLIDELEEILEQIKAFVNLE